jgi:glucosamine 6-phosphate synthetase-like amidotransferase/phosphosugar isomerase protein
VCGIAGYSLSRASGVEPTLAAQALLAGIAERGSDAVGYGFRGPGVPLVVRKRQSGASGLLEAVSAPAGATEALLHVRDYTKGHPSIAANNHPVRHGAVVGIHNGIIENDEEIFARHRFDRYEPEMTVDSEAIFALAEAAESRAGALEELRGAMAAAWVDERVPDVLYLARGVGRPLWLGEGPQELLFASTRDALELAARTTGTHLRLREVPVGSLLAIVDGRVVRTEAFEPDHDFVEADPLPAVRAPEEAHRSLALLASLVAAAA